ncbi:MAG TPA: bifunctional phosphoribosyl-AMP cyclohydrolase/phosphoribosyl-ATP diphosphatase HisIE [bacterium]|nr:bifunctional phosphoribosyl-AMP cyclohydrolase/phosphoribosyl-ATP diphosphatase HisIE [bacterium]
MMSLLWPVVVQDVTNKQVLMLAYANEEALALTRQTGEGWFWSRSRGKLWRKGETSGHTQRVVEIRTDCDHDALLYLVEQKGPACHTGERSCFFTVLESKGHHKHTSSFNLHDLYSIIKQRQGSKQPDSYVNSLTKRGLSRVLQKVGEEAVETILALRDLDSAVSRTKHRQRAVAELADLCFHALVAMAYTNIPPEEVIAELGKRRTKKIEVGLPYSPRARAIQPEMDAQVLDCCPISRH